LFVEGVGLGVLCDCTGEEGLKGTVTKGSEYLKHKELKLFCTSREANSHCCKHSDIYVLLAKYSLSQNSCMPGNLC